MCENVIREVAEYDQYAQKKLEDLRIFTMDNEGEHKISNVVFENKKL